MHAASAQTFTRMLNNLSAILTKAEAHAKAKGYEPSILLNARLAPDMLPLTRQVQIACDQAKGAMARLSGKAPEPMADDETSFEQLRARISRVLALVETFSAADLEGSETREIALQIPNMELKFSGLDYLLTWSFPNFYFHVSMAYAILRHNGVDLGKRDFLMS